jgi:copper chaperone CopZ
MRKTIPSVVALAVLGIFVGLASAQPPQPVWTKISLTDLHCKGCLKDIATQVSTVAGVAQVQGDVPTKMVFVLHQPGVNPSPRALWEAVEKTEHKIIKMESPGGTFTAKP